MKHFTIYLRCLVLWGIALIIPQNTKAQVDSTLLKSMDSVTVSLLTCGPGNEIYSYYGHTAIRYRDAARGQDLAINYGIFSFQKSFFILRFIFGLTDYEMGIEDLSDFVYTYANRGSWVKEQVLNLTREEKWAITQAIDNNYRPENRVYRYNYFYDNCTTRARDMIVNHINGQVVYNNNKNITTSYRTMIHQWNEHQRWARLGNDLLLGVHADAATTNEQQQFLPDSLRAYFAHAIIIDKQGKQRALVDSTFYLVPPIVKTIQPEAITPLMVAILWLLITLLVCFIEWKTNKLWWGYSLFNMLIMAILSIILLAMVFSQHPTVSLNFQILLFCPLHIFMLYPVIKQLRHKQLHPYIKLYGILLCSFLLLSIVQSYAEGIIFVAIAMLIRCIWIAYFTSKKDKR